jgi:nucleotide sugar dehydrogenase
MGQGYVGLPLALRAAATGLTVTGYEPNKQVVDALNSGVSHIDDVSDVQLREALRAGYGATSEPSAIAHADVVVVCVPTPLSDSGGPDLGAVESAATMISDFVRPGQLVVLESTTYPGTTEDVFAPLVLQKSGFSTEDVLIAFSPERIDPGNAAYGIRNTPKVVGGLTAEATTAAKAFYGAFIDTVVEAKGAKEAEMAKLLENTFRHVNIALVNEMVRFSDELGIDLWDAIKCAETKPFGFMAFRPGPGVGGHCIPVDPSHLSHQVKAKLGYAFRMVELAEEINGAAPSYVASRIWRLLNDQRLAVRGARILLLGVTYKANIADRRESPADPLAATLLSWGADLQYVDPFIPSWTPAGCSVEMFSEADLQAALMSCDVAVLLQAHRQFDLEAVSSLPGSVLDTRGVLPLNSRVSRL